MIFQDPRAGINPMRTVGDHLTETMRLCEKRSAADARAVASSLLAAVRMPRPDEHLRQYPHELSGGMLQRVMIAGALTSSPRLLICDEPTTALDVTTQAEILAVLAEQRASRGMGMLFITHDLNLAATICDRVYVMSAGRVEEQGDARQVFRNPQAAYTQAAGRGDAHDRRRRRRASPFEQPRSSQRAYSRRHEPEVSIRARVRGRAFDARPDPTRTDARRERGLQDLPAARQGAGACRRRRVHRDPARRRPRHRRRIGVGQVDARPHDRRPRAGRCGRHPIAGRDRTAAPTTRKERLAHARSVQMVFQDPYLSLDPRMTAGRAIEDALRLHTRLTTADARTRVVELLDQVGLGDRHAQARPRTLSGGQRQRVAIARALAIEPDVLVMDEATSALDVSVQAQVLSVVERIRRERGLTVLFISHDLAVVRRLCDETVVMKTGEIVERGRTVELLSAPQQPYTRLLIDSVPRPDWGIEAAPTEASALEEPVPQI